MIEEIRYAVTIEGVDWTALKCDLAADDFDNLRTPDELLTSFANSQAVAFAWSGERVVGSARLLSDGVCNAYLIDVWTLSSHRRRGIGSTMVEMLLESVPGHHVGLFTEEHEAFYRSLGFGLERGGMSRIVGRWLGRYEPRARDDAET
ncbi:MAG: GNAT family N-acetyltransferase [Actinomycetota bacterium]|nr:GNAT family N-acetyltransferase [Actinomycetota bacterium]